jgi:hypothetical protein
MLPVKWPVRPAFGSIRAMLGRSDRAGVRLESIASFAPFWRVRFASQADIDQSRVYEYTPFCNGPGGVKSPRVIVTPPSANSWPTRVVASAIGVDSCPLRRQEP